MGNIRGRNRDDVIVVVIVVVVVVVVDAKVSFLLHFKQGTIALLFDRGFLIYFFRVQRSLLYSLVRIW